MFQFDMKLLTSNSCRVNLERLDDFNQSELIRLMSNPVELSHLISELRRLVEETLKDRLVQYFMYFTFYVFF